MSDIDPDEVKAWFTTGVTPERLAYLQALHDKCAAANAFGPGTVSELAQAVPELLGRINLMERAYNDLSGDEHTFGVRHVNCDECSRLADSIMGVIRRFTTD